MGDGAYDVAAIRRLFPVLRQKIHGRPLVYLDNAATTQKPRSVIDAVSRFYEHDNSNIHRGLHELSMRATRAYEGVREKTRQFINAAEEREVIFVRGATEAVNLVMNTWGRGHVGPGDEVLITHMEHHSNIVPWQMLCRSRGARLQVVPITDDGELQMDQFEKLLGPKTRLVAVVHISNALGTINPVRRIVELAHQAGAAVLIDGAQAAAHQRLDMQALDCDFYAISGHKMYAPTGVGVLYGRAALLEAMPPYEGGGDMISSVTFEKTTYNKVPHKFEAGTPNIAGVIGLGAAIDFLQELGVERLAAHEQELLEYATQAVSSVPGLRIVGRARRKAAVLSFVMEGIHPHDIGTILDQEGIAIRAGHHCTQPLMERFGVPATARASFGCYNTREEIDALVAGIHKVIEVLG
ncbi:MAG TPA: cysteine desulfurase [Candidatus Polarisedimenticolia bacterium]|nr:cysteine desulfurase [Candidatus Polarisedimenticolia bacterium]